MRIYEVQDRNQQLLEVLLTVWENSVRATHLFLSDEEVNKIKAFTEQEILAMMEEIRENSQDFRFVA